MSVQNTLLGIETTSEQAMRDNNEGQRDGSQADCVDKFAFEVAGSGRSEQYDEGFRNGSYHQPQDGDDDDC